LLRLILSYEYSESGYAKFIGTNWFSELSFPFPLNLVSADVSWQMATWFELLGAVALALGLTTHFFSASLIVLTIVAIASVHWPEKWSSLAELWRGYAIEDDGHGNFKLPLLLGGAGKFSLDYLLSRHVDCSK
jgi:putative oxidoreductase